jgi:deoxyadenosine/deoxycytidine kinase
MIFLQSRIEKEEKCTDPNTTYIIDRCIYEDRYIFTENQIQSGMMNAEEAELYETMFQKLSSMIQKPDLIFYLKAEPEKAKERILQRGREMEKDISIEYL